MPKYRDGMKRITVDDVLAKVSLAIDKYVTPMNRNSDNE